MLNIGVLGTGFGKEHLRLFSQTPGCQVLKVYGRNTDTLERLRKAYDVAVTTDPSDIITDQQIDLVDICLPSGLHTEYALQCLHSSKSVFIETPLCYDLDDAEHIRETAVKMNRHVYVSSFIKFFNEYVHLKSVIDTNQLGHLHALRLYRDTPVVRGTLGVDTIVHHLMIHDLDFLSSLFKNLEILHVSAASHGVGEALVVGVLKANNCLIQLQGCSLLPPTLPMSVGYQAHFDSGELDFHCVFTNDGPVKKLTLSTSHETNVIELRDKYPYQAMIEHVVACENIGTTNILDINSAIESLELANEIKRKAITVAST
jgi:predicted dehydrogenase